MTIIPPRDLIKLNWGSDNMHASARENKQNRMERIVNIYNLVKSKRRKSNSKNR